MNTKSCVQKLFIGYILTLFLLVSTTTFAAYKPPTNPSRPKSPTGSNSTRTNGCIGTAQTTLTALTPLSHFGQTVSSQPTFVWFVPDTEPHEMEFSLHEYGVSGKGKLIKKIQLQSSSGIMKLSLSKEKISLSTGQKYLWQIALLCNKNNPSEDLLAKAVVEVVPKPPRLADALSRTKEIVKQADIYAEAGLWYDALSLALQEPQYKAFSLNLLTQLSNLEAEPNNTKDVQQHASQIKQIIAVERQRR
ncbi:MAG: DUF928 domain-containing protein [Rhizonema sp. PD37]|nr:DUF928 domain-containing protein [Rhizonema sp. PD37]